MYASFLSFIVIASTPQEPQVDAAALEQLEGMGFPRVRCQKALLKTGNQGAELAMNWLFEHMEDPDIDDPIQPATGSRPSAPEPTADQISMLADMGFTAAQAKKALRETDNDMQRAVEWLFSHSDDVMDEDADAGTGQQAVNEVVGDATPPITFRVSSFVSHKGTSVHCGHYVAHVRKDDNQWVLFNDNKVAATPEPPIREAYMYVLERVKA
ncbi:hypothetical protein BC938DRAFT_483110 [Jimgerdemannia flammicorona]|uniref:Ubiquitin carboxyl-terminal hydrolase 14 n=1 Tax=Jimgerdemannia flammicorona TaxID=994334 RepID=A0A433QCJ4_9FUNG|nr:hypothetical protein BC938DRAFT_483110 [Jimgerdemannia flammicorona]